MKKSCGGEFIGPYERGVWIHHATPTDKERKFGTNLVTWRLMNLQSVTVPSWQNLLA
jgi:hypothetical protein